MGVCALDFTGDAAARDVPPGIEEMRRLCVSIRYTQVSSGVRVAVSLGRKDSYQPSCGWHIRCGSIESDKYEELDAEV